MNIKHKTIVPALSIFLTFYCYSASSIPDYFNNISDGHDLLNNNNSLYKTIFTGTETDLVDDKGYIIPKDIGGKNITHDDVVYIKDTGNLSISSVYGGECKTSTSDPLCYDSGINYAIMDGGTVSNIMGSYYSETFINMNNQYRSGNTVTGATYINGGNVNNAVYGTVHYNSQPSGNVTTNGAVYVNDGTIGSVNSAFSYNTGYYLRDGDDIQTSTVNALTVISGGTINGTVDGAKSYISATDGANSTTNSEMLINGGHINGKITGSYSDTNSNHSLSIANSNIYINAGMINGNIVSASSRVFDKFDYGYVTGIATANGNIYINGGTINGDVNAAYAEISSTQKNDDGIAKVNGNIYFNHGTITGDIIGAIGAGTATGQNSTTTVNAQSHISIFNDAKLQDDSSGVTQYHSQLWGGYLTQYSDFYNVFSNNILSMGAQQLTVKSLGNFEQYNFYINDYNSVLINNDHAALITVTDEVKNDNTVTNTGITTNQSHVAISAIASGININAGDTITLIDASNADVTQGNLSANMSDLFANHTDTVSLGFGRKAEISYATIDSSQKLVAKVDSVIINDPTTKPLLEGILASMQNITRGADDLIALMGENKAVGTMTPIATITGGVSKYRSGSSIDTRDYRLIIGSRYQLLDNLYAGLALEYGRSNYSTHNDFATGRVNGDGHTYNYGVSLFAKYTNPLDVGHVYTDVAMRFGRTSTEFNSSDIITSNGRAVYYDSKTNYIGASVGVGYVYPLNTQSYIDSSLRYFYTRLGSDSIVIDGDNIHFQKSTSSRIQWKEQYSYQTNESMTFYLAGIYEYEMNGKVKGNIAGLSIDAPSVKGSTGIMELGVKATPIVNNHDFSINLNFSGYSGKRDGARVSALIQYDF